MSIKSKTLDIVFFVLGSVLIAISVSVFTAPNDIASGGFTGIAIILHSIFKFPVGSAVLLLNIPLFIIATNKFGIKFIFRTVIATMIMTVLIDVFEYLLPKYNGDTMLASIFGGLIMGTGLGMIFLRGATTGGVDIIAKLIRLKFPFFSIGTVLLILDAFVIIASAIVYQNIEKAMFAVIVIFVQSKVIDTLLYGGDKGRLILVKSEYCKEILDKARHTFGRIPTLIDNNSEKRDIILCATHRYEAARFHKIVKEIDKTAFIVTMEAGEIIGEGFKNYDSAWRIFRLYERNFKRRFW